MKQLLDLFSEDFRDQFAAAGTVQAFYEALTHSKQVSAVREAIRTGELTMGQIESFVRALITRFEPGKRFFGDVILACIAIAFKNLSDKTAESYLAQLGRIDASELPMSTAIAKIVLDARASTVTSGITARRVLLEAPAVERQQLLSARPTRSKDFRGQLLETPHRQAAVA